MNQEKNQWREVLGNKGFLVAMGGLLFIFGLLEPVFNLC